jgi:hypothetical protein
VPNADKTINNEDEDFDGFDSREDTDSTTESTKPWDPKKIRITTKTFTLRETVEQIQEGDIDLSPDFQREFVWKDRQRTRLIESILLGIPLPAFYFNQSENGSYQVVDGVQRLSTINIFMSNEHRLNTIDLEYIKEIAGSTYLELDKVLSRRFRSTQIVVHVIEPQTPDEVKYDIFNRVNTLGSPLSAQEIRHAMSQTRSRDFLKELVENKLFDEATEYHYWRKQNDGIYIRDSGRMANRELALRFCAFRACSIDDYKKHTSLDAFLIDFTKQIDGADGREMLSERMLTKLKADFCNAMETAATVLGSAAFRRWPADAERRGPINRAVFEAQANALADYTLKDLQRHQEAIVSSFRAAFSEPDYVRSVTVGTGDPNRVSYRLSETRRILKEAIQ